MASSEPEVPTWVKSDGDEHLFWAVFYANAPRAAFMSRISCSEWHKHQQSKLEPEKFDFLQVAPLPLPLEFTQSALPSFLQFDVVDSKRVHPCLIQELTIQSLVRIVKEVFTRPRFLLLSGPVKSGKTTLMNRVIPALIAENYRTNHGSQKYPIIFRYLFSHRSIAVAADNFCSSLDSFAEQLGLTHVVKPVRTNALAELDLTLNSLAAAIDQSGGCLWLLLDEFQVPLSDDSSSDIFSFIAGFKKFLDLSFQISRLCITGSGMLTMMQCIRMHPMQSFVMIDSARLVATGDSPDVVAATTIANMIVPSYSRFWPRHVQDIVTPQKLIETIQNNNFVLNFHPAVMSYLCVCLDDALNGTAVENLNASLKSVWSKVYEETEFDLLRVFSLWSEDASIRSALRHLASGDAAPLDSHKLGSQPILNSLRTNEGIRPFFPPYNRLLIERLELDGRPKLTQYVPPVSCPINIEQTLKHSRPA